MRSFFSDLSTVGAGASMMCIGVGPGIGAVLMVDSALYTDSAAAGAHAGLAIQPVIAMIKGGVTVFADDPVRGFVIRPVGPVPFVIKVSADAGHTAEVADAILAAGLMKLLAIIFATAGADQPVHVDVILHLAFLGDIMLTSLNALCTAAETLISAAGSGMRPLVRQHFAAITDQPVVIGVVGEVLPVVLNYALHTGGFAGKASARAAVDAVLAQRPGRVTLGAGTPVGSIVVLPGAVIPNMLGAGSQAGRTTLFAQAGTIGIMRIEPDDLPAIAAVLPVIVRIVHPHAGIAAVGRILDGDVRAITAIADAIITVFPAMLIMLAVIGHLAAIQTAPPMLNIVVHRSVIIFTVHSPGFGIRITAAAAGVIQTGIVMAAVVNSATVRARCRTAIRRTDVLAPAVNDYASLFSFATVYASIILAVDLTDAMVADGAAKAANAIVPCMRARLKAIQANTIDILMLTNACIGRRIDRLCRNDSAGVQQHHDAQEHRCQTAQTKMRNLNHTDFLLMYAIAYNGKHASHWHETHGCHPKQY